MRQLYEWYQCFISALFERLQHLREAWSVTIRCQLAVILSVGRVESRTYRIDE